MINIVQSREKEDTHSSTEDEGRKRPDPNNGVEVKEVLCVLC